MRANLEAIVYYGTARLAAEQSEIKFPAASRRQINLLIGWLKRPVTVIVKFEEKLSKYELNKN